MEGDDNYLSESEIASHLATIRVAGACNTETELASAALIQDFCLRQWSGKPQSNSTLDWLAGALSEIFEDGEPLRALGLAQRPNNRPPSDGSKPVNVALWVGCLESRGVARAEAVLQAAEFFSMDESSVRRLLRQAGIRGALDEAERIRWERYLLSIGKAVPTGIKGKK